MFAASALASRTVPGERRHRHRYPIIAIAQLRLVDLAKRANAVVHNISSDGAFFSARMVLDEGRPVQLLIDWPVRLDGRIPLSLVLEGMVVRSDVAGTAIAINRHEWRIRTRTREPKCV